MKIVFAFILGNILSIYAFSQKKSDKNSVEFSFGRIAFGTGDFFGYGANIEYTRRLSTDKVFLKHFSLGIELSFDDGNEQPKVINPTLQEFFDNWYYSTTNIVLTPKIRYHPFNKTFAKGFNISGGLSVGYTNQNFERQSTYIYDSVSQMSVRRSYLGYINRVMFGYRIIAAYEYLITKNVLLGIRMDFDNYNGDTNTLLGGKIGYCF